MKLEYETSVLVFCCQFSLTFMSRHTELDILMTLFFFIPLHSKGVSESPVRGQELVFSI